MPGATEDTLLDRLFSYYGPQEGDKKGRRCLEDSPSDLEKPIWKSRADFRPVCQCLGPDSQNFASRTLRSESSSAQ